LDELDVTELFDVLVVSGVVGVQKPDPDIYRLVLKRLGLHPQETIFVDDFTRNIEAAQELGMQTLHFRAGMDWKGELSRRLGVDEGKGMTDDEGRKTDDG
jgi:putative hydrolase of the HAD superfamily